MIDHILTDYLSIELIELTKLQRSINCFPNIKLLPKKSFSFTPLSLPLLLSLSLSSTVNFSIPFVSSHNFSYLYFDPERKISPRLPIITLLSIYKMESSLKQRGKRKIIPTKSVSSKIFFKNRSSMSIPMYFQVIMPHPDSFGALYFE